MLMLMMMHVLLEHEKRATTEDLLFLVNSALSQMPNANAWKIKQASLYGVETLLPFTAGCRTAAAGTAEVVSFVCAE